MNRKNGYEMVNLVEHDDDFTFLQVCRSSQLMMITISNDTQTQYIGRKVDPAKQLKQSNDDDNRDQTKYVYQLL